MSLNQLKHSEKESQDITRLRTMGYHSDLLEKIEKARELLDDIYENVARTFVQMEKSHPDNTETKYYKNWEQKMQGHISKAMDKLFDKKKVGKK